MRRNDREVTEETEIRKVLDECKIVHLGFQDCGRVLWCRSTTDTLMKGESLRCISMALMPD